MEKMRLAELYRMVMDKHVCPYGIKAKYLLERKGYIVEDNHLKTRKDVDVFKDKHGVKTTPQTFINEKRIGGYDDLKNYFGLKGNDKSYQPVVYLFFVSALLALAFNMSVSWQFGYWVIVRQFVAISMSLLALQKLMNVESFSTMFLNYDLLARKCVPYAYIYPFAELLAGVLMLGGILPQISIPIALFIGSFGAISVFKAVYLDKRELKCACVGGDNNVPLGLISLVENLVMMGMGVWMIFV